MTSPGAWRSTHTPKRLATRLTRMAPCTGSSEHIVTVAEELTPSPSTEDGSIQSYIQCHAPAPTRETAAKREPHSRRLPFRSIRGALLQPVSRHRAFQTPLPRPAPAQIFRNDSPLPGPHLPNRIPNRWPSSPGGPSREVNRGNRAFPCDLRCGRGRLITVAPVSFRTASRGRSYSLEYIH